MTTIDKNGNGNGGNDDEETKEALREEYENDPDEFAEKWGTNDPDYDPNETGDPHKN